MTITVLWYRKKFNELWCAADSRITNSGSIITDAGPKILPVPVVCHKVDSKKRYKRRHAHTYGFTFAGSTLSAISTHALATACTQNLASSKKDPKPVSLESVAELFSKIAESYIKDISFRQTGSLSNLTAYFFDAFIFGFCPVEHSYKAFAIVPNMAGETFRMLKAGVILEPNYYHPLGSGTEDFVALSEELNKSHPNPGVIVTLREMLKAEKRQDVGGHFQIGVVNKDGFKLMPILNLDSGPDNRKVQFLGWDVDSIGELDGYRIGYQAFSHHVD